MVLDASLAIFAGCSGFGAFKGHKKVPGQFKQLG
jgi:hypothetical protein